ncbi:MAG: ROK family protein [Eubacteriales bacterium]|nr:ROK family protein [Eubacteriales bacterium]
MNSERIYLGIDIGGTAVKMGMMTETGELLETASAPVAFDGYETPILTTVKAEAKRFADRFAQEYPERAARLAAIGVSATGQIDMDRGIVTGAAGHIQNWVGARIRDELEETLHLPVRVANDANCAALGEYWIGAARGVQDVIVLTVGTGVGGGVITGGKLLRGARGIAGELGHIVINGDGEPCSCGNRGCLEHYASTGALVRMVREGIECGEIPAFAGEVNGRTIFEALDRADHTALAACVNRWIGYLADGMVGLIHIFNPSLILIGGGVSAQEELFVRSLRETVMARIMPSYREGLRIERAALGNNAGLAGAVCLWVSE